MTDRQTQTTGWDDATTWEGHFSKLALLDGDEWEREHERLKESWYDAYRTAFVNIAVSRGWETEDAESWPDQIADEAFIETYRHAYDPARSAELDVVACEEPI